MSERNTDTRVGSISHSAKVHRCSIHSSDLHHRATFIRICNDRICTNIWSVINAFGSPEKLVSSRKWKPLQPLGRIWLAQCWELSHLPSMWPGIDSIQEPESFRAHFGFQRRGSKTSSFAVLFDVQRLAFQNRRIAVWLLASRARKLLGTS